MKKTSTAISKKVSPLHAPSSSESKSNSEELPLHTPTNVQKIAEAFIDGVSKNLPETTLIEKLNDLRKAILFHGLPSETPKPNSHTLRGFVWKLLLGITNYDPQEYINLIQQCKQYTTSSSDKSNLQHQQLYEQYKKIRGDSFRTFPKDDVFKQHVEEQKIIRICMAFIVKYKDHTTRFRYLQGMNCLVGVLLMVMPEVDAFFTFCHLIEKKFPLYWVSSHIGAEAGCKLVDECLKLFDPELSQHLQSKGLNGYVLSFHCVSSLSSTVPPLSECLKLWDFLICFGVGFNIVSVCAQIMALREQLLASSQPNNLLNYRVWPELKAKQILAITYSLLPRLPQPLFHRIQTHATDREICVSIAGRPFHQGDLPPNMEIAKNKK